VDSKIISKLATHFSTWKEMDSSPFRRKEINQLVASIKQREVTVITGCRGTGKSTALRYAANWLVQSGIHEDQIGYIDLEHPSIFQIDSQEQIESLVHASMDLGGREKKYLFLDEIGRFSNWKDWIREFVKKNNVSVVLSCSGSIEYFNQKTLEPFHTIRVFPFSLIEYIALSTDKVVDNMNSEEILRKYLLYGGLPIAINSKNPYEKLIELFYDTLFFDVLSTHQIRDSRILTSMAVDLLSRPNCSISATKNQRHHYQINGSSQEFFRISSSFRVDTFGKKN
jgi:predicted AAA+ superfamily ATPase